MTSPPVAKAAWRAGSCKSSFMPLLTMSCSGAGRGLQPIAHLGRVRDIDVRVSVPRVADSVVGLLAGEQLPLTTWMGGKVICAPPFKLYISSYIIYRNIQGCAKMSPPPTASCTQELFLAQTPQKLPRPPPGLGKDSCPARNHPTPMRRRWSAPRSRPARTGAGRPAPPSW
jgi:hypothetical protein